MADVGGGRGEGWWEKGHALHSSAQAQQQREDETYLQLREEERRT